MSLRDDSRFARPQAGRPGAAGQELSSASAAIDIGATRTSSDEPLLPLLSERPRGGFGVYVHIPFCRARCDYCAFATWTDRSHLMEAYVEACCIEVDRAVAGGIPPASSVYFGGGTPSALPPGLLGRLLARVPVLPEVEVTVECNPQDLDAGLLASLRAAGVNRLSLGVQSMVPGVLEALGRAQDPSCVPLAVAAARREGFEEISLDLIYGAAGETDAEWTRTLGEALALEPTHLSAYALTVEPGTALALDRSRHPDPDLQARRYEIAEDALTASGLRWYELSNWAHPGHECRHNRLYWSQGEYVGIGCAAHSHRRGQRWWNLRTPERYVEVVSSGRSPVAAAESLGEAERSMEALWLSLRTREGVPGGCLPGGAGVDHLVDRNGGRAVLNLGGRMLANEVAARLVVPAG